MSGCPLLFTFTEKVAGEGFMADVKMRGRILMVREDGGIWMYGVQPGGIAAGGENEGAAYLELQQTLKSVFFDIAIDSPDYNSFQRKIRKFFREVSGPTEEEWWEAVKEARQGRVKVEGIPTVNADTEEPFIKVSRIQIPRTAQNVLEPFIANAIAA